MKVAIYVDAGLNNFGDDLNRWLWSRILDRPLNIDDGILMLGIGTLISRGFVPPARKYIVLGSGTGYDAPPADFGGPKWEILSVRGPLTAAVLDLPPETAVVDASVLVRLLPECEPLPASERHGIVFMPHYETLALGNWRQASEMAGFEFLDPLADSEQTVQRIRGAKLVIADAMHAAIVADALRVPWIPVVISPVSNSFKWMDWTLSLNLPYRPVQLQASTLLESLRNRSYCFYGPKLFFERRTVPQAIEHYKRIVRLKSWKHWPRWKWRAFQLTYLVPERIIKSAPLRPFKTRRDEHQTYCAARQLLQVAEMPSYLSDEDLFMSKLEQTTALLQNLAN